MQPMTNSQIAARDAATQAKYRTRDGAPPIPPVLSSYSYGRYSLVWDAAGAAEVRGENNTVYTSGPRAECVAWLRRAGIDAA